MFKVPVIRLQDYKLNEIDHKKLWLFYPFMALQFMADLKGKKHLSEQEVIDNYGKMISYIETAYNNGEITIDEDVTLLEAIQKTNWHAMKSCHEIVKGVEDTVSQTLELKHKQIRQETAAEATAKATKETELKMLLKMKIAGIPESAIIKVAQGGNIPEEEVKKILNSQE